MLTNIGALEGLSHPAVVPWGDVLSNSGTSLSQLLDPDGTSNPTTRTMLFSDHMLMIK